MAIVKMVKQSIGHEQDGQTDGHCHGQDLMAMSLFSHLSHGHLFGHVLSRVAMAIYLAMFYWPYYFAWKKNFLWFLQPTVRACLSKENIFRRVETGFLEKTGIWSLVESGDAGQSTLMCAEVGGNKVEFL